MKPMQFSFMESGAFSLFFKLLYQSFAVTKRKQQQHPCENWGFQNSGGWCCPRALSSAQQLNHFTRIDGFPGLLTKAHHS